MRNKCARLYLSLSKDAGFQETPTVMWVGFDPPEDIRPVISLSGEGSTYELLRKHLNGVRQPIPSYAPTFLAPDVWVVLSVNGAYAYMKADCEVVLDVPASMGSFRIPVLVKLKVHPGTVIEITERQLEEMLEGEET